MTKKAEETPQRPAQHQDERPGQESKMRPTPITDSPSYRACGKLMNKVALITGGDSGIGEAVAIAFAKEGADVAILYLGEHTDAEKTKKTIERYGRKALLIPGDAGDESHCKSAVESIIRQFGRLDIVVNNAAEQHPQESVVDISAEQLERTFRTNIFSYFFIAKAALPYLKAGAAIINTTSVTAYRGSPKLLDYSATKGAIVTFTRSLSASLAGEKIRVNAVAPGPIWTPLIPSTFDEDKVAKFGSDVPLGRAGEPAEVAPAYVFLACDDSSYVTGQVIHPNGGEVVNA